MSILYSRTNGLSPSTAGAPAETFQLCLPRPEQRVKPLMSIACQEVAGRRTARHVLTLIRCHPLARRLTEHRADPMNAHKGAAARPQGG